MQFGDVFSIFLVIDDISRNILLKYFVGILLTCSYILLVMIAYDFFLPVDQTQLPDSDSENEAEDFSTVVSANVDIKKFLMFLYGMQLNNSKTICSIVHGKMVKLHLEQPGALSLQYFLTQLII